MATPSELCDRDGRVGEVRNTKEDWRGLGPTPDLGPGPRAPGVRVRGSDGATEAWDSSDIASGAAFDGDGSSRTFPSDISMMLLVYVFCRCFLSCFISAVRLSTSLFATFVGGLHNEDCSDIAKGSRSVEIRRGPERIKFADSLSWTVFAPAVGFEPEYSAIRLLMFLTSLKAAVGVSGSI